MNRTGLDELLAGVARGLAAAQRELDQAALATSETIAELPEGPVHLRPLWFVFGRTTMELELSTFVASGARFEVKVSDPITAALQGTASSTRLKIELQPLGLAAISRSAVA